MARMTRAEVFSPEEIDIVHVMNRVVRRCFLLGTDDVTGKNYDHRKVWIEQLLEHFAAHFGIDLITYSLLSNHFHLILRNRPDVVSQWSDAEVARRWLMLCPLRKQADGTPKSPTEAELNSIRNDPQRLEQLRRRLSDISWWMRLLCQRIAMRANREDSAQGKFFEARFKAVRLLDDEALLACAAYVDLNPIRAALAETLEKSDFTAIQRRIKAVQGDVGADQYLSPMTIDGLHDSIGPSPSTNGHRCSDLGFLSLKVEDYLQLLDWTARQLAAGKCGRTPATTPPILERLQWAPASWCTLVGNFGRLFYNVAGKPQTIDSSRSRLKQRRFNVRAAARSILMPAGT